MLLKVYHHVFKQDNTIIGNTPAQSSHTRAKFNYAVTIWRTWMASHEILDKITFTLVSRDGLWICKNSSHSCYMPNDYTEWLCYCYKATAIIRTMLCELTVKHLYWKHCAMFNSLLGKYKALLVSLKPSITG